MESKLSLPMRSSRAHRCETECGRVWLPIECCNMKSLNWIGKVGTRREKEDNPLPILGMSRVHARRLGAAHVCSPAVCRHAAFARGRCHCCNARGGVEIPFLEIGCSRQSLQERPLPTIHRDNGNAGQFSPPIGKHNPTAEGLGKAGVPEWQRAWGWWSVKLPTALCPVPNKSSQSPIHQYIRFNFQQVGSVQRPVQQSDARRAHNMHN